MVNLTENNAQDWFNEINAISVEIDHIDGNAILESAKVADRHLSDTKRLKEEIRSGKGFVELSGLPIDTTLPAPPINGKRPRGKGNVSELCLLGVTHALGLNPFAYREEKGGALVHEIAPIPDNGKSVSSEGTVSFDFHTDGAYLDRHLRPHTLSLLCLVDEAGTGTQLASLRDAVRLLDGEDIDALMSDEFRHTAPETFKVAEASKRTSVLDRLDGVYEVKAALHNTQGLTPRAKKALDALRQALVSVTTTKRWKPGDLVIFSNLRCMHGRGEIRGRRWLQRCYGSHTLPAGAVVQLNR
ncbi:TauD/TfdA family dioxygenase [Xanthomonas euvesicatoria]|uniref:TauD/TfdA family dioxygenase n=1 Tax=Xanthomonas euvesicatoria TaxID=456327 RepID=UPI001C466DFF|nr:TauD/TfdA family dioxygenase [Xanthomonas euvesicatoria]MBV6776887.1 TauD/TfdA family dioxygenase [Xanthomonas campestris pv. carissae]